MKKAAVLLFLLGIGASHAASQVPANVENSLYVKALSACVSERAERYGKGGFNDEDFYNVVVEPNLFTTVTTQTRFGQIKVEYLSPTELRDRYKKNRQKISLLAVRPMELEDGQLEINIAQYWFSYEKHSYNYGLSDGCVIPIIYDCDKRQYVLGKVKLVGI